MTGECEESFGTKLELMDYLNELKELGEQILKWNVIVFELHRLLERIEKLITKEILEKFLLLVSLSAKTFSWVNAFNSGGKKSISYLFALLIDS